MPDARIVYDDFATKAWHYSAGPDSAVKIQDIDGNTVVISVVVLCEIVMEVTKK